MNDLLDRLNDITLVNHNTELEVDLADCLQQCVVRIGKIESKLITQIIEEEDDQ